MTGESTAMGIAVVGSIGAAAVMVVVVAVAEARAAVQSAINWSTSVGVVNMSVGPACAATMAAWPMEERESVRCMSQITHLVRKGERKKTLEWMRQNPEVGRGD
jgi:hypothetical protein